MGLTQALDRVARDVTRTAHSITRDQFLEERAKASRLSVTRSRCSAAADKRAELPSKAVIVGDGLTVFDLLISARAHPVGVALTERASGPRTRSLLRLLGVPSIVGCRVCFAGRPTATSRWSTPDYGLLVINPSKSENSNLREFKRSHSIPRET